MKLQIIKLYCPASPKALPILHTPLLPTLGSGMHSRTLSFYMGVGDWNLCPWLGQSPQSPHTAGALYPASRFPLLTSWLSVQVMLVVKYWTLLFVGAVVLSLSSYVLMTSLTQSLWMYRISPKTFPFLCELPLTSSGGRELSG